MSITRTNGMVYFLLFTYSSRMEPSSQQSSAIPIAIICGFAMIAIAIFFTNKNSTPTPIQAPVSSEQTTTGKIKPVDATDYILGNPNAPILMVEYSDYDCPFCKQYHTTLNQIMDEYGVTGRVAWVYRQLPLGQLHPNAPKLSESALCVGSIGGNEAFWKYTEAVFASRDINEQTNITRLPEYATLAGVNEQEFISCLDKGTMKDKVTASIEDAYNAGADGTPYTVLIVGNQQAVITGAQPYDVVKGIVVNLINQLDGNVDTTTSTTTSISKNPNGVPVLQ